MAEARWSDEQAIDAWLTFMRMARGRSDRTLEVYELALTRLREFLQGKPLLEVDAVDLETFCGLWLHRRGVVAASRKPYISAVRGFYTWLAARSKTDGNAAVQLEHPKAGRPLPRTISLANAERLMWAPDLATLIGIRDAAILSLLIGCGLRVSGLVGLNEGNLHAADLDGAQRMVLRVVEKGMRERIVPVPREAEMLLRVYMGHEELAGVDRHTNAEGRADKVLFVSMRSTCMPEHLHVGEKRRLTRKAIHDIIQRYGRRLEIPQDQLHPHALRHLFGTELTEEEVPTAALADLMGHADPKTTGIYIHLATRRKIETVDKHGPLGRMKTPVSELLKRLPS